MAVGVGDDEGVVPSPGLSLPPSAEEGEITGISYLSLNALRKEMNEQLV